MNSLTMKKMEPENTVSIIVPVYNTQNFLKKCVESILAQTFRSLEILLVDDGSRDDSPRLCDAFAAQDPRVQVIHKENGGLVSAWMAGVKRASGKYLMFVDSDDWIDACMTEELVRHASGKPGEIVCCNYVIERPGSWQECRHALAPGVYEGERLEKEVKGNLLGNENRTVSMSRCMKLFSRELITENLRFPDPGLKMGEDVSIVLPALCDCRRLVILQDALYYHYFFNPASMVHKYDPTMAEQIRELLRAIRKVLEAKQAPDGACQLEKESVYLTMLSVKNELRGGRKGYAERTVQICRRENMAKKLKQYGIRPQDNANRIIAAVMRRPDRLRCACGRLAFALYDAWAGRRGG